MTRLRLLVPLLLALLAGARPAHAQAGAVDLTGKWAFTVVTENGTGTPTVYLKQKGDSLTGTYESPRLGTRPLEGSVKGQAVRLVLKGSAMGAPDLTFVGLVLDKDNLKGTLEMGEAGSASFSARRAP